MKIYWAVWNGIRWGHNTCSARNVSCPKKQYFFRHFVSRLLCLWRMKLSVLLRDVEHYWSPRVQQWYTHVVYAPLWLLTDQRGPIPPRGWNTAIFLHRHKSGWVVHASVHGQLRVCWICSAPLGTRSLLMATTLPLCVFTVCVSCLCQSTHLPSALQITRFTVAGSARSHFSMVKIALFLGVHWINLGGALCDTPSLSVTFP